MPRYVDLDLNFLPHPVTGDVRVRTDAEAVRASIKHLVLTSFGERLFQPTIGTTVNSLLFELATPITGQLIRQTIKDVISRYEPRAEIIDVIVKDNSENNAFDVSVLFYLVNQPDEYVAQVTLERAR